MGLGLHHVGKRPRLTSNQLMDWVRESAALFLKPERTILTFQHIL